MLELRDVHAGYGKADVLFGVNLKVPENAIVALLGRNGAGKTTTLRAASGLLRLRRGEVIFDDDRIDGMSAEDVARCGIAHVPEGRGVFSGLSVRENLELGGHRLGTARRTLRPDIDRVCDVFPRLRERLSQRAGSLSGGEQQMLVLARALMSRPRLMLVDEPSLGLAPIIVQELYEMFGRLTSEGITVLLVEQYVELALKTVEYAYVLEKGAVTLQGSAAELQADRRLVSSYLDD
jgi:branched-chain amino acid transport system ATP-binding protein